MRCPKRIQILLAERPPYQFASADKERIADDEPPLAIPAARDSHRHRHKPPADPSGPLRVSGAPCASRAKLTSAFSTASNFPWIFLNARRTGSSGIPPLIRKCHCKLPNPKYQLRDRRGARIDLQPQELVRVHRVARQSRQRRRGFLPAQGAANASSTSPSRRFSNSSETYRKVSRRNRLPVGNYASVCDGLTRFSTASAI
jgi:hypothetical protein